MLPRPLRALAVLLALACTLRLGGCTRPTPARGAAADTDGLASSLATAQRTQQQGPYHGRKLQLHQAGSAAARSTNTDAADPRPDADDAAAAQHVALVCTTQLEQLLAGLPARGLQMEPAAQQEAAVNMLAAEVERLAVHVIGSTRANLAALRSQLQGSLPKGATPADMAALLQNNRFQDRLKDARDDALLAVTEALEQHLPALAQSVHAVLAALVRPPGSLEPLPEFSESFLPPFSLAFSSGLVEAMLLHALWRD